MNVFGRSQHLRSACIAAVLCVLPAAGDAPAQQQLSSEDQRERLTLPADERNMVLAEMRLMLRSLSDILGALGNDDLAAAAEAARSAGTAAAVDVAPAVRDKLPAAFMELGMATHRHFDTLAERLEEGADRQEALIELTDLTAKCVACHATYRLDEAT